MRRLVFLLTLLCSISVHAQPATISQKDPAELGFNANDLLSLTTSYRKVLIRPKCLAASLWLGDEKAGVSKGIRISKPST